MTCSGHAWSRVAIMAAQVSYHDESAVPVGRRIEAKARNAGRTQPPTDDGDPTESRSLLGRILARLAA
jgi:hypothetical protein